MPSALEKLKEDTRFNIMRVVMPLRHKLRRSPLAKYMGWAGLYETRGIDRYLADRWQGKDEGWDPAPPAVKRLEIINEIKAHGIRNFVETGTYLGMTTSLVAAHVDKVWTIEVSERLYGLNKQVYADIPNIEFLLGGSEDVLPQIVPQIQGNTLYWLDGHFSAGITGMTDVETPIMKEVETIAKHNHKGRCVLLIDDIRCFNGTHDYPTLDALKNKLTALGYQDIIVRWDILRCWRDEA
ncbi:MAG: hypothetical protein GC136_08665 [Alphaproteobacteria bacterium]|nr:hypothetical protein [Alphaproteobacteria bacterium]